MKCLILYSIHILAPGYLILFFSVESLGNVHRVPNEKRKKKSIGRENTYIVIEKKKKNFFSIFFHQIFLRIDFLHQKRGLEFICVI